MHVRTLVLSALPTCLFYFMVVVIDCSYSKLRFLSAPTVSKNDSLHYPSIVQKITPNSFIIRVIFYYAQYTVLFGRNCFPSVKTGKLQLQQTYFRIISNTLHYYHIISNLAIEYIRLNRISQLLFENDDSKEQ